jgi:hypothetical protein
MPPRSRHHQHSSGNHQFCIAAFLDFSQAFDKVWHPGILFKIKQILPIKYYNLLKSYLQERHYVTKYNNETSRSFQIHSGVPHGSNLVPLLYILYTSDLPTSRDTDMGTFAYDTAIFSTHADPTTASRNLQEHFLTIENWLQKWKIKVNETNSSHITFTLRKDNCPAIRINQTVLPQVESVKYLGLHFDRKLNWKVHIKQKKSTG